MNSDEDFSRNNQFATKIVPPEQTLGVERELGRFAHNQYLMTRDPRALIGTNDRIPDEDPLVDDLLLTNAVTENTVQDNLDKTRYLKEAKSYITINSAARQQPTTSLTTEVSTTSGGYTNSLFSSDGHYDTLMTFAPFVLVHSGDTTYVEITSLNNHIRFQLQDWTHQDAITQIVTPEASPIFDVFLPVNPRQRTLDQLQTLLETTVNLVALTGTSLEHSSDPNHMFTIDVSNNPQINPDRAIIQIGCQGNYRYSWDFYSMANISSTPIARPISASEGAFVIQNPSTDFPFPNSYALDLDKAYINVKSIRIISSEMPNTDTIININNNHLTFQLIDKTLPPPTTDNPYSQNIKTSTGSIDWEIYLPYGNYTLDQLVSQMTQQINQTILDQSGRTDVFHITANSVTGVFSITTKSPYAFTWNFNANPVLKWRNLYQMLGFQNSLTSIYATSFTNLISVSVGSAGNVQFIQRPYRAIMLQVSGVIWVQLNNYETIYDTLTQNKYFCKFNLDNVPSGQYAYDTFTPSVHVFVDAPLPVLSMVDVRLYDEVGMPYNFNGVDHSFTLEITRHIDRLMGTDFNSRRGVNDKSSYV